MADATRGMPSSLAPCLGHSHLSPWLLVMPLAFSSYKKASQEAEGQMAAAQASLVDAVTVGRGRMQGSFFLQ